MVENSREEHYQNVLILDRNLVEKSVKFLSDYINDREKQEIFDLANSNPDWWIPYHFFGIMGIRNLLRCNGFGEKEFNIDNLDDYTIGLIELAVGITQLPKS